MSSYNITLSKTNQIVPNSLFNAWDGSHIEDDVVSYAIPKYWYLGGSPRLEQLSDSGNIRIKLQYASHPTFSYAEIFTSVTFGGDANYSLAIYYGGSGSVLVGSDSITLPYSPKMKLHKIGLATNTGTETLKIRTTTGIVVDFIKVFGENDSYAIDSSDIIDIDAFEDTIEDNLFVPVSDAISIEIANSNALYSFLSDNDYTVCKLKVGVQTDILNKDYYYYFTPSDYKSMYAYDGDNGHKDVVQINANQILTFFNDNDIYLGDLTTSYTEEGEIDKVYFRHYSQDDFGNPKSNVYIDDIITKMNEDFEIISIRYDIPDIININNVPDIETALIDYELDQFFGSGSNKYSVVNMYKNENTNRIFLLGKRNYQDSEYVIFEYVNSYTVRTIDTIDLPNNTSTIAVPAFVKNISSDSMADYWEFTLHVITFTTANFVAYSHYMPFYNNLYSDFDSPVNCQRKTSDLIYDRFDVIIGVDDLQPNGVDVSYYRCAVVNDNAGNINYVIEDPLADPVVYVYDATKDNYINYSTLEGYADGRIISLSDGNIIDSGIFNGLGGAAQDFINDLMRYKAHTTAVASINKFIDYYTFDMENVNPVAFINDIAIVTGNLWYTVDNEIHFKKREYTGTYDVISSNNVLSIDRYKKKIGFGELQCSFFDKDAGALSFFRSYYEGLYGLGVDTLDMSVYYEDTFTLEISDIVSYLGSYYYVYKTVVFPNENRIDLTIIKSEAL